MKDYEQKAMESFWGFQSLICSHQKLMEVTQDNYREKIFGMIEELSKRKA